MKKLLTVVAACACAMSLTACGSSSSSSSGNKDNTLVVGAEELTGTFSPLYYSSSYDGYVVDLVYNKLMEYDVNNTLQSGLAESYEASADGTSLTFHLKEGIKFSDGSKFDAKDVELSYKIVSDPSYTGRFGSTTAHLLGYADYSQQDLMGELTTAKAALKAAKADVKKAEKKKDDAKIAEAKEAQKTAQASVDELTKNFEALEEPAFPGIEVVDDYTIKFTFDSARNDNITTLLNISVVSDKQMKDYKYKDTKVAEDTMKTPVGTGAYVLDKWESGAGASFSKNKNYSKKQLGGEYKIENVIIKPVAMETEYEELKSGGIDYLAGQIEPKKIGPATNNKDLDVYPYARGGEGYIAFNTAAGSTSDKAVRKALAFAFDRQAFVDSYYECDDCKNIGDAKIGYVPTVFNNPLSQLNGTITGKEEVAGLESYNYDIEKAKSILDEAGWVVGADGKRSKDGQPLEVKLLAIKEHDILDNLIPMWKKSWESELGVTFKVATVDFNTLIAKLYSDEALNEWNVFFMAMSYTSDSMSDVYTTFSSKYATANNDNYARLKDPTLDALMDTAMTTMDPAAAVEAWKAVSVQVNEDCAYIPVYGNTYFDIFNSKLKNMKTSALYQWTKAIKDASIEVK